MHKKFFLPAIVLVTGLIACTSQQLQDTAKAAKDAVTTPAKPGAAPLSNDEVINGLREALTVGTNNSTAFASKMDGFYKNPSLFIPFPPEAQKVKDWAAKIGMTDQVNKF